MSKFWEKRVVIVRNYLPLYRKAADPGCEELLKFAKERQDSSVLIFVLESRYSGDITAYGKKMIKAASAYEFGQLDKADLKNFINKRIHAGGKIITRRDLEFLIDVSGYYNKESEYDLTRLDADLSKIVKEKFRLPVQALVAEQVFRPVSGKLFVRLPVQAVLAPEIRNAALGGNAGSAQEHNARRFFYDLSEQIDLLLLRKT